jgi:YD repeat-containing protein
VGREATFGYDELDRQTSFTDTSGETENVSCDAEGRVVGKINRNGKRITYLYNGKGQVTRETWYEEEEIVKQFDYEYIFGNSRLSSVTDGENTWDLSARNIGGVFDRFTFAYAD